MPLLHDPAVRSKIEARLKSMTPQCHRQWGSMTCDQILWHVNQVLEFSLGERSAPVNRKFASQMQAKHLDHHFKQFSS